MYLLQREWPKNIFIAFYFSLLLKINKAILIAFLLLKFYCLNSDKQIEKNLILHAYLLQQNISQTIVIHIYY